MSDKQRICASRGCKTILSRYNKAKYCNRCLDTNVSCALAGLEVHENKKPKSVARDVAKADQSEGNHEDQSL